MPSKRPEKGKGLLPVTVRLAEQLSLPCWFKALHAYSPLSAFVGLRNSRDDVVEELMILYLSLCLISEPNLNHLKVTFGAASISHSNLAGLSTFVSRAWILCLKTGGTELCTGSKKRQLVKQMQFIMVINHEMKM